MMKCLAEVGHLTSATGRMMVRQGKFLLRTTTTNHNRLKEEALLTL
jgi:hypothetical protein